MKTLNRKPEQIEVQDEQSEYVNKNIWRLTNADIKIKYSEEMVAHWQKLLKENIEEKNELLIKAGFV